MKILIYDNNPKDMSRLCEMIKALPVEFFVDKATHYEDCVGLYEKYEYDIVFVDFSDDIGRNFLTYILDKNPNQRIITLSNLEACSSSNGCDFCDSTYNKKRVVKPIKQSELMDILLKKYVCKMYCNDKVLITIENISKTINTLAFDSKTYTFFKNGSNNNREMSDIIELTNALDNQNIKYKLIPNGIEVIKAQ